MPLTAHVMSALLIFTEVSQSFTNKPMTKAQTYCALTVHVFTVMFMVMGKC